MLFVGIFSLLFALPLYCISIICHFISYYSLLLFFSKALCVQSWCWKHSINKDELSWFLEPNNDFTILKSPLLDVLKQEICIMHERSRQICRNCAMFSCQFGLKSKRNVSSTFLNIRHNGVFRSSYIKLHVIDLTITFQSLYCIIWNYIIL